ncbi:MAG: topoisomerase II [Methylococcaceae bacterium]|nr:topoisomerase II [Methylococcaceae bacterium]
MIRKYNRSPPETGPGICPVQLDLFTDIFELADHPQSIEDALSWTDLEIQDLRDRLLLDAIDGVADRRRGAETRAELLAWVTADEIKPFSFTVCCLDTGIDPDELRDMLLARPEIRPLRRAA